MKTTLITLLTICTLLTSTSAFAGGHRGGHGGGSGNPWPYVAAAGAIYAGVSIIDAVTSPRRVVHVQPSYSQPVYRYTEPVRYYPGYNSNSSYGFCNGSPDYCRGMAEAQKRRAQEYRQMEYERGLNDGMR
jgi:hypothetical protein